MPRKRTIDQTAETLTGETPATAPEAADTAESTETPDTASAGDSCEPEPPECSGEPVPVEPAGPEPWDSGEIAQLQLNWNEKTETREIGMPLTKAELSDAANALADTVTRIRELEDAKKASADRHKALIVDQEKIQNAQSQRIRRGTAPKPVPCRWLYQVAGRDAGGRFVRDDNYKTLIRIDSGEVIGTSPITAEERQMALPLEEAPPVDEDPKPGDAADSDDDDSADEFFLEGGEEADSGDENARETEAPETDAAFEAGAQACRDGADIGDNPHPDGSDESFAWDRGWTQADKEQPAA